MHVSAVLTGAGQGGRREGERVGDRGVEGSLTLTSIATSHTPHKLLREGQRARRAHVLRRLQRALPTARPSGEQTVRLSSEHIT